MIVENISLPWPTFFWDCQKGNYVKFKLHIWIKVLHFVDLKLIFTVKTLLTIFCCSCHAFTTIVLIIVIIFPYKYVNVHFAFKLAMWCGSYVQVLREFNHVNPQDDEEGKVFANTRVSGVYLISVTKPIFIEERRLFLIVQLLNKTFLAFSI